jgi:hypothetical protein
MAHHRYTRTPADKASQKARSDKNKLKPAKPKKVASDKVRERKLKVKEEKRAKFISKLSSKILKQDEQNNNIEK